MDRWGWGLIAIMYVFVVGFRYHVGSDWISYHDVYWRLKNFGLFLDEYDVGYFLLNKFAVFFNLGYYFVLSVVAFFTIFFAIHSVGKAKFLLPLYLFFFFCIIFNESLNIIRQILSCFACFYAINKLIEKDYKSALFSFLLAYSFHGTCLVTLSYIPFLFFNPFKYKYFNIVLILSSFIFGELVYENFKDFLIGASFLSDSRINDRITDYGFQVFEDMAVDWAAQSVKYVYLLINLMIIWYSPQISKIFDKYRYSFFFSLFMIGQILHPILVYHSMFQRINYYYYLYCILIMSYFCYTFWRYRISILTLFWQRVVVIAILLIYLLLHIRHIIGSDTIYPYYNYFFDVLLV